MAERVADPGRTAAVRATGMLDSQTEAAFDRIALMASRLLEAPFGFVTFVDEQRSFWKACAGVDVADPAGRQSSVSESFCQYVIGLGEALLVDDVRLDERTMHNPSIESMGVAAWAGVPLRSPEGEVLGTVCVVDTDVRRWNDDDARLLDELSALTTELLAARRAHEDASQARAALIDVAEHVRSRGWLDVLAHLTRRLSSAKSVDEVAEAIDSNGAAVVGADRLVVGHLEAESGLIVLVGHDAGRGGERLDPTQAGSAPFALALRSGKTVAVGSRAQRVDEYPDGVMLADSLGAEATATVPLRTSEGSILGVLIACWSDEMSPGVMPLSQLEVMAEVCAQSIARARLADDRRALVASLQTALLSPPPPVAGVDLAVRYVPALDSLGFGGDWYDVVPLDGHRVAVIVGDVVGHNAAAAARMSQVRTVIATLAQTGMPISELFAGCDKVLAPRSQSTMATVAVVVVNTAQRTLTSTLAGHPTPLLASPDGSVDVLAAGLRPPLGVGSSLSRPETVSYSPGSVLLAYTDGLAETRDGDVDTDLLALSARFGRLSHLPPEQQADRLLAETSHGLGHRDDVALVVARLL